MTHSLDSTRQHLPVSNYGSAVARALEWLGDRYLLAKPINASTQLRGRPAAARYRQERAREDR
jgi:hypothetical protein